MKNRLVTIAGALALLAVLGRSYATPASAQWVKVALVKNVDEKGRAPYMQFQARSCPGGGATECQVVFPPVPAGKRLVLECVNASVNFATNGVRMPEGNLCPQRLPAINAVVFADPVQWSCSRLNWPIVMPVHI